jgi:hypothetical protein
VELGVRVLRCSTFLVLSYRQRIVCIIPLFVVCGASAFCFFGSFPSPGECTYIFVLSGASLVWGECVHSFALFGSFRGLGEYAQFEMIVPGVVAFGFECCFNFVLAEPLW